MKGSLGFVFLVALVIAAGCVAPAAPVDPRATETAIAAGIIGRLTAEAAATATPPAATPPPTDTPSARPPQPAAACTVRVEGLNLRSGPGTAFAPPLGQLAAGTLLLPFAYTPVGDPDGQWLQVRAAEGAAMGWVAAGSVDCNIDLGTLPVAPLPRKATPTLSRTTATTATASPTSATATLTSTPGPTASPTPTSRPIVSIQLPAATLNGMAVDPERGYVFVAGRNTDKVYVVDPELRQVIKEITVGRLPFGVTYHAGYIHVADFGAGGVSVIDPRTLDTLPKANTGRPAPVTASIQNEVSEPTFIAAEPASDRVMVVLHGYQEVYHRHVYMYRVAPDLTLSGWASVNELEQGSYGIATLPARNRAYVSNRGTRALIALDTTTGEMVEAESLRDLPWVPYYVASMNAARFVYVTHNAPGAPDSAPDRVSQFMAYSGAPSLVKTVTLGDLGDAGGFIGVYRWRENMTEAGSPYDGSLWIGTPGKVTVFDPTLVPQAEFGPEYDVGPRPYAIAFDPARRRVYVADAQTNTVTVLSGW